MQNGIEFVDWSLYASGAQLKLDSIMLTSKSGKRVDFVFWAAAEFVMDVLKCECNTQAVLEKACCAFNGSHNSC